MQTADRKVGASAEEMPVLEQTKAQVTSIPHVVDEICLACDRCIARSACRSKAIVQIDRGEAPLIDPSRCYGCRACVPACPHGAILLNGDSGATTVGTY